MNNKSPINNGTSSNNYIIPDITVEVPILKKYCTANNNYECRNLERIMFRAKNMDNHKNNYFFEQVTRDNYDHEPYKNILNHIANLMKDNEKTSVIIDTCDEFYYACKKRPYTKLYNYFLDYQPSG